MPALNPLFIGLLIAGVVLVIGVFAINWLQERRVRRRIDATFSKSAPSRAEDRVEPMLSGTASGDATATVETSDDVAEEPLAATSEADDPRNSGARGSRQRRSGR